MQTTKWVLDPTHSEVQFRIKHLMMTNVTGWFQVLSGEVMADDKFTDAKVQFTIDARSISTGNEQRDKHLKGADFFDVEKYPEIGFESGHYNATEGEIHGTLTIKGVSKPVTFEAEFNGTNKDPWGNLKAGFSLTGKINRKDWGLEWNAPLEAGGVLVSEDVRLNAEVQFTRQEE
jgi:polyisoprenoid-binding protein YceI